MAVTSILFSESVINSSSTFEYVCIILAIQQSVRFYKKNKDHCDNPKIDMARVAKEINTVMVVSR